MSLSIYESPDGGRTVYRRDSGCVTRHLVQSDPASPQSWSWQELLQAAQADEALSRLLEPAKSYYLLKYTK